VRDRARPLRQCTSPTRGKIRLEFPHGLIRLRIFVKTPTGIHHAGHDFGPTLDSYKVGDSLGIKNGAEGMVIGILNAMISADPKPIEAVILARLEKNPVEFGKVDDTEVKKVKTAIKRAMTEKGAAFR
jgi:hypothetical protein